MSVNMNPGNGSMGYAALFHQAAIPMALYAPGEDRFLEANVAFLGLVGCTASELLAKDREWAIWDEGSRPERLAETLDSNLPAKEEECTLHTRLGQLRPVGLRIQRVCWQGRQVGLLIAYDLRQRLTRERQVRHMEKMAGIAKMAAGFAHDFNNLLAVMQGYAGLLLAEPATDPQSQKCLKEITLAAKRAADLTRQLLVFSRRQAGKMSSFDLNGFVQSLTPTLSQALGEKVELRIQPTPTPLAICGEAGLLQQALVLLATNAQEAMPMGGVLTITTEAVEIGAGESRANLRGRPGQFAQLRLQDTGCGMDELTLGRSFEPFFTTKTSGHGTGMGLPMVYGIIKQQGGWIEVASVPGQGSTFDVFLPLNGSAPSGGSKAPPTRAEPVRAGILVVEDEAALRSLVEGILSSQGHRVFSTSTGAEGLRLWRSHRGDIQLVLTDIAMPEGMTGVEMAEVMRSEDPAVRIIYTSGYTSDLFEHAREELVEGVNFLQKPYLPQTLLETVQNRMISGGQCS